MVEVKTHLQRPSLQAIGRWLNRCGDGRDPGLQRPGTGADGAAWKVAAGAGGEQVQLPRFLPSPLQIKADDTERWANQSPKGEPHTVTPLGGEAPPEYILIEPQARGPPKLVANPAVLFVASGKVYGGQGYVSSGVLRRVRAAADLRADLRRPGEYRYCCAIHVSDPDYPEGMVGTITVAAG